MKYFLILLFILNTIPVFAHSPKDDFIFRAQLSNIQRHAREAKNDTCEDEYDECGDALPALEKEIDNFNSYVQLHYILNPDHEE